MDTFIPYFEKQKKKTERADHIASVSKYVAQCPCIKLVHNYDWNDYGHFTWFVMWVIEESGNCEVIGNLKIMNRRGDVYELMPDGFESLGQEFCSVGMDTSYYKTLKKFFGKQRAERILKSLRDCATDTQIYETFNSEPAFLESLGRDLATQKAIKEARFLIEGRDLSRAYSFDFSFSPIYNKNVAAIWSVHLEYGCPSYKRTYSVIGENGVGKTQLMANLVKELIGEHLPNMSCKPMISSVMVICASEFDAYKDIETKDTRVPVVICDVVQTKNTLEKLTTAINDILKRGTYYVAGEMLMMYERYIEILCTQLGASAGEVIKKEDVEVNGTIVEQRPFLDNQSLEELVNKFSTGQLQVFSLITYVCANIHLNSIVVIDEPEVHLHPKLITIFVKVLNDLLEKFDSYAIIATHSPLVVRECVRENVYVMVRNTENIPTIGGVAFNTFGEDISLLYQNIFECDDRDSFFYETIEKQAQNVYRSSYEKVVEGFKRAKVELSYNGRMIVRDFFDSKE